MTRPYDNFGHKAWISAEHYRIHEGESFLSGYAWTETSSTGLVADNESVVLYISPGAGMHAIANVAAGGDCDIYHYSGVTTGSTGAAGNLLTPLNKNGYSSNVSKAHLYWGSTDILASLESTDGVTQFPGKFVPGGTGGNAIGGQDGGYERETVLRHDTGYATVITNRSGQDRAISASYEWYEPGADTSTS